MPPKNSDINLLLQEMQEKIKQLEKKLDEKDVLIKNLEGRVNELENKLDQDKSKDLNNWSEVVKRKVKTNQGQNDIINTVLHEEKERNKRKNNIIIFGVKLANHDNIDKKKCDEDMVNDIFDSINADKDKIKKVIRLKTRDTSKIPPVIIELDNASDKISVLKAAYINRNKINEIYFNSDMTESERDLIKQLRSEVKLLNASLNQKDEYYYTIRNFKIVKLIKKPKQ